MPSAGIYAHPILAIKTGAAGYVSTFYFQKIKKRPIRDAFSLVANSNR